MRKIQEEVSDVKKLANRAKLKAVKPKRKNIKTNSLQLSKNNQRFSEPSD